jgi:hypothetical protein
MPPLSRFAPLLVLALAGCNAGTAETGLSPSEPTGLRRAAVHADPVADCRFSMPDYGLRAVAEHFDPALPPEKLRHTITLATPFAQVLRVDVWHNPDNLALQPWFDKHLGFSVASGATVLRTVAGPGRHEAIVVHQPRSPQSQARRIATFLAGGRVFRLTCLDGDDAAHVQVWQQVMDSFEPRVRP